MNLRELVSKYPEVMSAEVQGFGNSRWVDIKLGEKTYAKVKELQRIRHGRAEKLLKILHDKGYRFNFTSGGRIIVANRTDEQNELSYFSKTGSSIASCDDTYDELVGQAIAAARAVEDWDTEILYLFQKLVNPGS